MNKKLICATPIAIAAAIGLYACGGNSTSKPTLSSVKNVVVIYAENRSFDNLYGNFPGANGLQNVTAASARQLDRDGSVLATLPPVWKGLTAAGVTPVITQAMTVNLPNSPFAIDDPAGFNTPLSATTRDLYHRFYENQMQIHGGKNDMFAAWADSGGLVMGHYTANADKLPLYKLAQQFTLADNFFMGAFGGSFLNHQWLVCACTPFYANADTSVAKTSISAVQPDGVSLTLKSTSAASALTDVPTFVNSGNLTPDFYAVNTMQPPYQPSGNKPAAGGDANLADPTAATTLPAQTNQHIGDLLNNAGVTWAWYSGAWSNAISAVQNNTANVIYGANLSSPNFQPHHQPFNYFADLAPGTDNRAKHLLDGGLNGSEFIKAIDAGTLPQVAFYKPQGNLNEHPGYTDVAQGDQHIADVISHLQKSPQWNNMVVVITYDENGGFWDHVAPPKGDRWGPGTRIPAIIVSPYAKKGFVDHTQYDTTSILRFITHRFNLPNLPGLTARDSALVANGGQPMGDLTNALDINR
ncbi:MULTISPECIES: acid phosphatase [Paraburkholderia]|uniref:Acid phosphatase n=1 Tax=Paraburkholderia caribensis TaxID=75105 RepID=A0A9Q6WKK9_9BURK|nr:MULTISPECIES: acid phosphatase [Paraburkholderia]ALP64219.1 acid phosphatase [Paraburkholderia caribensis]AUT53366.1 acid phosphatase [Paraburkholderia caribensis]MCO4881553.1 acid phosphatase [Paraburkholderia caribensis]MDR6381462.1 acid phosphatase [Paraburkholderia caribensis]PTB24492.1 acid phosphatase [Paraburkholderia caribensis]